MAVVLTLVMVLVSGGYFIFFELLMRGQTPGKKAMKSASFATTALPQRSMTCSCETCSAWSTSCPFAYALGAVVMFPNPLCKRLGDLAAGTIVVKEGQLDYRANADKKRPADPVAVAAANAELTAEERRVITGFLQRRAELLPEARRQLAERLAGPLHAKYAGQYRDAESYLERLAEGRHYES